MGNAILNGVCVLVTAAFAITLVPGFRQPERSLLSRRDQGTVLLVFLVLGLVEEVTVSHAGWLNERIVAVCAAGLVAGPWVGLAVGGFVTWLALCTMDCRLALSQFRCCAVVWPEGGCTGGALGWPNIPWQDSV